MKFIFINLLLFIVSLNAQERDLPDILFSTSTSHGGYGRLIHDVTRKQYELFDGRTNSYVVDGQKIRQMRLDEGGGTMANPESVVTLDGRIFGASTYAQICEFDAQTGAIRNTYSYGPNKFSGGAQPALYSVGKVLVFLTDLKATTLNSNLEKLNEITLDQKVRHVSLSPNFIQMESKLYGIEVDNPNTYSDCAGGCNLPTVIRQTVLDFTNPLKIETKTTEEKISQSFYFSSKAVTQEGWFLVTYENKKKQTIIEFRAFSKLSKVSAQLEMPAETQLVAMSTHEPVFLITKSNDVYSLKSLTIKNNQLVFGTTSIDWVKGSNPNFYLETLGKYLFVTTYYQLAVYDLSGPPNKVLQQNFVGSNGSNRFFITKLYPAELPRVENKVDGDRVKAIIAKDYWNDRDQLALESDVIHLTANDKWAIPIFVEVIRKKKSWYNGGMTYSMKALEIFGTEAAEALPFLLKENLGSSYSEPQKSLSFSLIKKIDPSGEKTIALTKANLEDAFKVRSTVELYEYIGSPKALEVAKATRTRWKLK